MKNTLKLLSLLFVVLFTVSACSKDDDPVDNDLFTGNYTGDVGYDNFGEDGKDVTYGAGSVRVYKIGDKYSFDFKSDAGNIPSLTGIVMQKGENNTIFFNSEAIGSITISESTLELSYTNLDTKESFRASCDR
ncbi:hypothetical protein GQF61_15335 [Sphingobacterium sp. DK4209]|uniref:Lipocalin-like domain-containing protein n=1 Tax=Sphingobacterium zhuxiongii TaxID=2662364 RepID=A0A5Q0Q9W0_9SPHI|nr:MULTISPECIES: hypothetical protein [unclassified Sphingobacterium]MVZ67232.1 hypothetical protein [Sphingobacterium sp. DK4209]QGA26735.1 hypothetical protein GFH32_10545 [Sphingobacterium sp. dk4302]